IKRATGSVPNHISEEKMEVVPLDELQLRPNFIKIDVQGLELQVLKGAMQTIKRYRPLIMVENGTTLGPVFDELASIDYRGFRFAPERGGLVPLEKGNLDSLNVFFAHEDLGVSGS
ncbi:MAG: FkbM family methyltransferase, partial [Bdellovibrionales bacterium]|nr:FkbM family methyltransferase [Bdellovibrionales bacterium]